ncbi:winged helix DNA-binding domain-containing protein [Sphaerisporangium sp. TRM90804]|uniref:winged helix DNA-binding domain-containing protein n=1 Tax=Sphaerisporangium sp. TRM90804 TaxID=3031113 RepID=UPI0024475548|nr:winged helix DNA-binding domain-containing protein [Sphaerisporangium sp. TRM90804]MDH2426234.1 winged helix DNA-binding domain-containing protein [Sphaerisporangium sp. TRM90804]
MPRLTFAEVCARRLERHALNAPAGDAGPAEIAAAMAGVHAQVMPAAELSVGLRLAGATRADVRRALWSDHSLVKTFGPRGTVHLLPARDLPLWVAALSAVPPPRVGMPDDVRMTPEQTEAVVAAVADALKDSELTNEELDRAVVERTGPWAGERVMPAFQGQWPRWRQAVHLAGVRGALCFGPNRGRKVTYTGPARLLPGFEPAGTRAGLAHVLRSYLHAYGPATPRRFAHWLNAPPGWAEELFTSLEAELEPVEVEGTRAWVSAGDTGVPPAPPRGVRLLPYFDGYAYRVGNQPPELLYPGRAAERVLPRNFQVLLVDGVVAGLWHQRRSGRVIAITVEPVVRATAALRREIDRQAGRVGEIMEGRAEAVIGEVTVGGHA